jgi:hypothetical protein
VVKVVGNGVVESICINYIWWVLVMVRDLKVRCKSLELTRRIAKMRRELNRTWGKKDSRKLEGDKRQPGIK